MTGQKSEKRYKRRKMGDTFDFYLEKSDYMSRLDS